MGNYKTPSGWKRIKLGEYLTELSERNNTIKDNGTPVLSVTNRPGFSMSEEYFDKKVFSKDLSNYKIIQRGQFAYNPSRVNIGSIARLKEFDNGLLSPMYVTFEAKKGLNGAYLDHWMLSPRFRSLVKAGTQGSVRNSLNFSALADFPFDLPSGEEQKEIVTILDCIDFVIDQTHAVIDQTQAFKKGLMQELFTRGIPGRHKKFKKIELGEIPEEWRVSKLENVAPKISDGIHTTPKYVEKSKYYFINGNNLENGKIVVSESTKCVCEEEYNKHRKDLNGRSILISINGTIGNIAFYRGEFVVLGKSAAYINCGDEIDINYIYYLLQSHNVRKYFSAELTGSTIQNLSLGSIRNMPTPIPDNFEQGSISRMFVSIDLKINKEQNLLLQQENLKQALMQVLLTGEVRVKA